MTDTTSSQQDSQSNGSSSKSSGITSQLPVDRLLKEAQNFGLALFEGGVSKAENKVEGITSKLNNVGSGAGIAGKAASNIAKGDAPATGVVKATASKAKDAVGKALGKGGGGDADKKLKVTNIVEEIDVPVPRSVAYNQWTQFEDFPSFMKKVENVSQESDEKMKWQAKILWSKRTWESEIVEQVPDEKIVWKSSGEKGRVNGAVTFHELAPNLTRILMTLEYHPGGLFEHTGNIWRAQGRRARLELKHFRRHVSTHTLLEQEQEELEGWRGEIKDGNVTKSHEDAQSEEDSDAQETPGEDSGDTTDEGSSEESGEEQESSQEGSSEEESPAAKKSTSKSAAKKSGSSGRAKKSTSSGPAKKSAAKKTSKPKSAKKSSSA
jgi:uncharacterized membrane protein